MSHEPIGYTYDADHHCPECADEAGMTGDNAEDSEGNPVGALFSWDEWWDTDGRCESLHCGDCGELIDTAHADPHSEDCDEWEAPEEDDDPDPLTVAAEWHGGQWSPLYSLASTGTIVPGVEYEIRDNMRMLHAGQYSAADIAREEPRLEALLAYVEANMPETATFTCRDIGYGVECGEVYLPARSGPDWAGKRTYRATDGTTVYLFDDELDTDD